MICSFSSSSSALNIGKSFNAMTRALSKKAGTVIDIPSFFNCLRSFITSVKSMSSKCVTCGIVNSDLTMFLAICLRTHEKEGDHQDGHLHGSYFLDDLQLRFLLPFSPFARRFSVAFVLHNDEHRLQLRDQMDRFLAPFQY